jgi:hypothetical protein
VANPNLNPGQLSQILGSSGFSWFLPHPYLALWFSCGLLAFPWPGPCSWWSPGSSPRFSGVLGGFGGSCYLVAAWYLPGICRPVAALRSSWGLSVASPWVLVAGFWCLGLYDLAACGHVTRVTPNPRALSGIAGTLYINTRATVALVAQQKGTTMSTEYKTFEVTVTMEVTAPADAEFSTNNIQQAIEEHLFEFDGDLGNGIQIHSADSIVNECVCDDCKLTSWEVRFESLGHSVSVIVSLPTSATAYEIEDAASEKLHELDESELSHTVQSYNLAGFRIIKTGAAK